MNVATGTRAVVSERGFDVLPERSVLLGEIQERDIAFERLRLEDAVPNEPSRPVTSRLELSSLSRFRLS